jgi:hypothetical protein
VLSFDNFKGHNIDGLHLIDIHFEFFAANLTVHVQPCGVGIIQNFKAIYGQLFIVQVIDTIVASTFDVLNIFDIDHLTAMQLAKDAWSSIKGSSISNY